MPDITITTDEGVTFTLRPENGFDAYLRSVGYHSTIITAVGRVSGYDCPIDELPVALANMAYDFASVMMVISSDKPHALTKYDITRDMSDKAIKAAWAAWQDVLRNDELRTGLLEGYKAANLKADDPLVESAEANGVSAI